MRVRLKFVWCDVQSRSEDNVQSQIAIFQNESKRGSLSQVAAKILPELFLVGTRPQTKAGPISYAYLGCS